MKHYNYIYTGTGLAALLTVHEMILSNNFVDKSILLIDSDAKKTNDRTWCFWDDSNLFDKLISKEWKNTLFANENFKKTLNIEPYHPIPFNNYMWRSNKISDRS